VKFTNDIIAQIAAGVAVEQESVVHIFGSEGSIFVPSPWFCAPPKGTANIIVQRRGETKPRLIVTNSRRGLYSLEADTVAAHIANRQARSPAMSWDDTLGNMKALDEWRASIGLTYNAEKIGFPIPTLTRRPLRVRPDSTMKYGHLPGIEKPISRLVMGAMLSGTWFPNPHGHVLFDDFFERGGNCFDTAHQYLHGHSEKILGQWIKNRGVRKDVVILGKGAHTPFCDPENLTKQLLESLDRLQTDHLDIYLLHRDNPAIPVGEFVDVLNEHQGKGRLRSFGGSNWSIARVEAANAYARRKGLTGFSAVSNNFSLARMVDPIWAGCIHASDPKSRRWFKRTQLALFAWSSQARGFFFVGDPKNRADAQLARCWYSEDNFRRLERARQLAKQRGVLANHLALAYVLNQPFPTFALIGPQTLAETRTSWPALAIELSPLEMRWLNLESEVVNKARRKVNLRG
jgi:aryl-alcohol dehydrogenase-like predicted oxidoreductase